MLAFAVTIFSGAFLLFQVQPLIVKYIVPWFGGSHSVWTTAVLFFQVVLFAGYAYAHLSTRRLAPRQQVLVHLSLVLLALAVLPIAPSPGWKPTSVEAPTFRVLVLLTFVVGLPYFVLAATSPLTQAWFHRLRPGDSPYRLYALSNSGSLLALLSYPFVFERALGRSEQAAVWSWGFGFFAVAIAVCGARLWRQGVAVPTPDSGDERWDDSGPRRKGESRKQARRRRAGVAVGEGSEPAVAPGVAIRALWLALPATASALMLSVTNQVASELGVVPLLWVLPLSLYLLSLILVFDSERWYKRWIFGPALIPTMMLALFLLLGANSIQISFLIAGWSLVLFMCCMACHGELARLKPHPRYLTTYYLMISGGGALGGLFVALLAPAWFDGYLELHVSLWFCCAFVLAALAVDRRSRLHRVRPRRIWAVLAIACGSLLLGLGYDVRTSRRAVTDSARNFYGVLSVTTIRYPEGGEVHKLNHGLTTHGLQFLEPGKRVWPTSYYSAQSGAGLLFRYFQNQRQRNIGVVGLGVGTLATYAREGDRIRFYEINPQVVEMAARHFTYLEDTPAQVRVALGDARLTMEREPPRGYDMLFLDAFSSHSVPVHLLTVEAFKTYLRHLAPNGVIAVHVSHMFLDLQPVVRGVGEALGLDVLYIANRSGPSGFWQSHWMLLTRSAELRDSDFIQQAMQRLAPSSRSLAVWTDDHSDVLSLLKRRGQGT